MLALQFVLFLLTVPAVLVCAYLLLLTVAFRKAPGPTEPGHGSCDSM